jgi:hypothetical protein
MTMTPFQFDSHEAGKKLYTVKTYNLYGRYKFRSSKRGIILSNVAEPHHFYAAPAPGINFDAAPVPAAPAPAPTLLYS